MINLLKKEEGGNRYAIATYAIVALAPEKLLRVQEELSFTDNPTSFQILSEALNKPAFFNFEIGDMFSINTIMLTHFFNKYRQRSSKSFINLSDASIIERFRVGFNDAKEYYSLSNDVSDFITFSENILPHIALQQRSITKWLPGNLIDKIGVAYQDAKSNADLLDLAVKIMQRKQSMSAGNNNIR